VAHRILGLQDRLIHEREQFRNLATKDTLTGLWSRGAFGDLLARELDRAYRLKTEVGLLFLDIDHFKEINDTHGHLVGDLVLKEVAARLSKCLRSYDSIGRYGGEEFCVVLPGCPISSLGERAESIRKTISGEPFRINGLSVSMTVSVGASTSKAAAIGSSELMAIADVALYRAKSAGRDCSVLCQNPWHESCLSTELLKGQCVACESYQSGACIVAQE